MLYRGGGRKCKSEQKAKIIRFGHDSDTGSTYSDTGSTYSIFDTSHSIYGCCTVIISTTTSQVVNNDVDVDADANVS